MLSVELPASASIARTDQVCRKLDRLPLTPEGVGGFTPTVGFSFFNRVKASNYGFYFVGLKPWAERTRPELAARAIVNRINAQLHTVAPEAIAFAVMPPSIPGLGSQGGFSFWLQDRSGATTEFLDGNLQKFLAAARRRAELVGVTTAL